ncbi:TPA: SLC13 family permease [Salmonella enterica]|uniref:SLC13/DASS family transporter n=1 Tax=Salmonella enterica TaxID=28901 RepID=A0A744B1D0_SALER|nr:SLC13/DASS family transporter [Salmonella enterica subsp. enterica serovar Rubislaw]EAU0485301.1 SLC13/DASS family transporter [Salmonella enterica]EBB7360338.1 SLC13/DASS family transporter [Salmonella enterica]EBC8816290.1 SLC13/DASS family transporter [Salmonella enterica]EBL5944248.1 SLC13/DASS family transporter [Salmonella enterica subsp. enterica serovar Rubislaw]
MEPITLTLCLLVFAIVMFVWEKVPLAVTSMIVCVALVITGVLSNTGTAAVLIPVVIGVAAKSGFSRSRLLMPLVFAAALGGNLSLIGAPGNLIAQSALQNIGGGFGFFEYAKIGLPMLICGILYFLTIGYRFLPNNATGGEVGSVGEQRDYSHVPQWKQRLSLVVLIATILGMIFEKKIGVSLAVTGCIGALVLVVSGVLTEKQAYKAIDSQTIFIFGGTLALAKALEMTGAGKLVADYVIGMLGQNSSPFMLLIAVFALSVVMTNFMSNTATTALLVPVSLSIAAGMGADPRAVLMATVIGGSCAYATPIGMPANMMVLSAGGYKFVDYAKAGIPLIIVSTIVSLILLPILFPFHP